MENNEFLNNLAASIVGNIVTDQEEAKLLRWLCTAVQECLERLDKIGSEVRWSAKINHRTG